MPVSFCFKYLEKYLVVTDNTGTYEPVQCLSRTQSYFDEIYFCLESSPRALFHDRVVLLPINPHSRTRRRKFLREIALGRGLATIWWPKEQTSRSIRRSRQRRLTLRNAFLLVCFSSRVLHYAKKIVFRNSVTDPITLSVLLLYSKQPS